MPVAVNFTPSQDRLGVTTIPVADIELLIMVKLSIDNLCDASILSSGFLIIVSYPVYPIITCRKVSVKHSINQNANIAYKYIISETIRNMRHLEYICL